MTAYAIGHIEIKDRKRYADYEAGFFDALAPFDGTILAADDAPSTLEGTDKGGRMVILSFPDKDALNNWYNSDAYQKIAAYRHEAANSHIVTVSGFEMPG